MLEYTRAPYGARVYSTKEASHSGLVHCLGKAATGKSVREFESLRLRIYKNHKFSACDFCILRIKEQATCVACEEIRMGVAKLHRRACEEKGCDRISPPPQ